MKAGWQTKRLGDFTVVVSTGPFGSILHKSDYVNEGVPLVNPINIVGESIIPDPSKLISGITKRRLSNYVLEEGDVVVGRRGEIGRCAVIGPNEKGWVCGTGSFFIRPLPTLDSQFLAHLIRSNGYREKLEQLSTGATMKNLSNTALRDLAIAVPPLPEQRRIVGILDEAFDGIATAKANAEKNLQNARALFESHLQSVFTQCGEGWVEKRLRDVSKTQYGLSEPMNEEGKGFKIFRMGELQNGRLIDTGRMKFADIDGAEFEKYKLQPGDVLFNRTNSFELVGKTGIFDLPGDYCFASYLVRVLLNKEILLPYFLNYFMNSQRFQDTVKQKASQSINQANINATILSNESVRFPESLHKQRSIVAQLDSLREETQALESIYQQKLAALDALKKSLLHQAFNGQL